ncbi:MAG: Ig-like domain-containing protein, partial [Mycobacterium sp.]
SSATLTTPGDRSSRDEDAPTDEATQPRATAREFDTPVVNEEAGEAVERPAETRENPVAVAEPTTSVLTPQPEDTSRTSASAVPAAKNITTGEKVPTATATAVASTTAPATPVESVPLFEMLMSWWNRLWRNSAPTLTSRQVAVTLDDSADVSDPIVFGGVDPDGDALSYSVSAFGSATGPQYGTVTIDQATGTFKYNPVDALTVGTITDTFKVTVVDSGVQFEGLFSFLNSVSNDKTTTATITVVVGAVNEAPKAVDDKFSGIADSPVTGNVLANDTDREGEPLTAAIITNAAHGVVNFESDGNFTYTPDSNFTGTDGFTYRVSDGTNTSLVANVTLTMAAVSQPTTPTVGIQGLSWWLGLSDTDTNRALDMSKSAGVTAVRIDISWHVVEYEEGAPDWSLIDPLVDKIVDRDMAVLGMLYDTPAWLSGTTDPHAPPTNPQLFAQFAAATAEHYLGRINTWEVWNEQNIPRFWASPSPADYAELLKAVYPAIKAVDPSATVITGGLSPDSSGIDPLSFVTAMYAAGAGGYFDAISMHPYSFPQLPTIDSVKAVHDVMTANGDGDKKVWLTEVGAPTGTSPFAVSDETQALSIALFVDFARTADYVGPVYLYSILDTGSNLADPEDNFGLIRQDFTTKPAFGIWL